MKLTIQIRHCGKAEIQEELIGIPKSIGHPQCLVPLQAVTGRVKTHSENSEMSRGLGICGHSRKKGRKALAALYGQSLGEILTPELHNSASSGLQHRAIEVHIGKESCPANWSPESKIITLGAEQANVLSMYVNMSLWSHSPSLSRSHSPVSIWDEEGVLQLGQQSFCILLPFPCVIGVCQESCHLG